MNSGDRVFWTAGSCSRALRPRRRRCRSLRHQRRGLNPSAAATPASASATVTPATRLIPPPPTTLSWTLSTTPRAAISSRSCRTESSAESLPSHGRPNPVPSAGCSSCARVSNSTTARRLPPVTLWPPSIITGARARSPAASRCSPASTRSPPTATTWSSTSPAAMPTSPTS